MCPQTEFRQADTATNNAKDKAKKLLDEAKKASSLTGNQELPPEVKQVLVTDNSWRTKN